MDQEEPKLVPDGAEVPSERRRRFDRQRPLQNPDAVDRPPRRDEEGPQSAGPPRGPRRRGPGAGGPPDPNVVFDRFDENGDGQLSRAEFMRLAERMQQMRDRGGPGQDGPRMRQGRGQGGPGGEEARPRRRRPARPEFDDDVSIVMPNADNSV